MTNTPPPGKRACEMEKKETKSLQKKADKTEASTWSTIEEFETVERKTTSKLTAELSTPSFGRPWGNEEE